MVGDRVCVMQVCIEESVDRVPDVVRMRQRVMLPCEDQHDDDDNEAEALVDSNHKTIATKDKATSRTLIVRDCCRFILVPLLLLTIMGAILSIFRGRDKISTSTTIIMGDARAPVDGGQLLHIVSFNVAGGVPSQAAPSSWTDQEQLQAIRGELLLLGHDGSVDNDDDKANQRLPHVIALQECDSPDWWRKSLRLAKEYQSLGSTSSHAGYVTLLVRQDLAAQRVPLNDDNRIDEQGRRRRHLPAVAAIVNVPIDQLQQQDSLSTTTETTTTTLPIFVASLHLEPFQGGWYRRQEQLETLADMAKQQQQGSPLPVMAILIGDTNMRDTEDEAAETTWRDAWKDAGADPSQRNSWNTERHEQTVTTMTRGDDIDKKKTTTTTKTQMVQNLYYGSNTRAYTNRYDRCYYMLQQEQEASKKDEANGEAANNQEKTTTANVASFQLIANRPLTNPNHFLSDHFGLWVDFNLTTASL